LPTVLTKEETGQIIRLIPAEYQLMVRLLYGSGLRLLECLRLRIKDDGLADGSVIDDLGFGDCAGYSNRSGRIVIRSFGR